MNNESVIILIKISLCPGYSINAPDSIFLNNQRKNHCIMPNLEF